MARFLIVDDHQHIRDMLRKILEGVGHQSYEAANGYEALKIIKDNPIDIMFLDLMMPLVDGELLFQKLKENNLIDFKICILSALSDSQTIQKMVKMGVTDYCTKPIDKDSVLAKVNALLGLKERSFPMVECAYKVNAEGIDCDIVGVSEEGCLISVDFAIENETMLNLDGEFLEKNNIDNLVVKVESSNFSKGKFIVFVTFQALCESYQKSLRALAIKGRPYHD